MNVTRTGTVGALCLGVVLGCLVAPPVSADGDREKPAWRKTLTQEQRDTIEHQHHELDDAMAPYKTREKKAQMELNEMTVQDAPDVAAIHAKIDELMAIRTQILRMRYEHLIEMRSVLTEEQKRGYDQGVLKRTAIR